MEALDPAGNYEVVVENTPPAEGEQPGQEFTIKVVDNGQVREEFPNVHLGRGPKSVEKTINERSKLIRVEVRNAQGLSVAERAPAPGKYAIQAT
ncbi:phage tail sheath family protein, partial [Kibdelosporangium lantanae]